MDVKKQFINVNNIQILWKLFLEELLILYGDNNILYNTKYKILNKIIYIFKFNLKLFIQNITEKQYNINLINLNKQFLKTFIFSLNKIIPNFKNLLSLKIIKIENEIIKNVNWDENITQINTNYYDNYNEILNIIEDNLNNINKNIILNINKLIKKIDILNNKINILKKKI